jgi:hypothetical protein
MAKMLEGIIAEQLIPSNYEEQQPRVMMIEKREFHHNEILGQCMHCG